MKTAAYLLVSAPERKRKLVEAAMRLILRQGFSATTVDQVCAEAGVTKGSFFHYFASKEEIGLAALDAWMEAWGDIVAAGGLDEIADPLERLDRLFDVMGEAYMHPGVDAGCVIGTVAQELSAVNRNLGDRCEAHLDLWKEEMRKMLADAKEAHPPKVDFDPDSVADLMLGIVQGSMLVAKTRQDRRVILNNMAHCRAYIDGLFGRAPRDSEKP